MEFGHNQKMTVGIRREKGDADGNKYQTTNQLDNQDLFKESMCQKNGQITNFNKAAGVEHQQGKHELR